LSHTCPFDARCLTLFHFLLYIQPPNIWLSKHCSRCSSTIAHRAFALYPALHYLNYIPSNIPLNVIMLTYLWLLLPMLVQAAHRGHAPRRMASSMAWSTGTATPSASDDPCKKVFLTAQPSNDSSDEPGGRVPAKLAYECLNSIPFNQSAAAALLESVRPYLEWQSTTSYVKDPPEKVCVSNLSSLSRTDIRL
jgi:hypothetical protein